MQDSSLNNSVKTRAENISLKRNGVFDQPLCDALGSSPDNLEKISAENAKLHEKLGQSRSCSSPQADELSGGDFYTDNQLCNIIGVNDAFTVRQKLRGLPRRLDIDGRELFHRSDIEQFLLDSNAGKDTSRYL